MLPVSTHFVTSLPVSFCGRGCDNGDDVRLNAPTKHHRGDGGRISGNFIPPRSSFSLRTSYRVSFCLRGCRLFFPLCMCGSLHASAGAGRDVRELDGRGRQFSRPQEPEALGVDPQRAGHHGGVQPHYRGAVYCPTT